MCIRDRPADARFSHRPILRMPVGPRAIPPIERLAIKLRGTAAQVFHRQIHLVGPAGHIVFERAPRHRVVMPLREKAAGLHHRIGDGSGRLFEHEPLDCADLGAIAAVDRRGLHTITGNQGMRHGDLPAYRRPMCYTHIVS